MIRLPLIFVACFVCVIGAVSGASGRREDAHKANKPYFVGDFNTCDFSQWQEMQGPSAAFKIIRRPKVEGRCAAALTIGPWAAGGLGNSGADGAALWLRDPPYGQDGHTVWQHFSVQFAKGFQAVPGVWNLFLEWHNDSGWAKFSNIKFEYANLCWTVTNLNGMQRIAMRIISGPSTAPQTTWVYGPVLRTGHWYDFLARTVWSANQKTGVVQWWLDGRKLFSRKLPTLYIRPDGSISGVYFIADHYRRHASTTTTIRFDGFRLGPTRASVKYARRSKQR